jgi:tetratricopeptide (TPR) repeat protein
MSRYSEVQHTVLPRGVSSRTKLERVPLQAAFDLIIPSASFRLLNRLQAQLNPMIELIRETTSVNRQVRRYRYAMKLYNFDAWLDLSGGRVHLYMARDRAPYGGGLEVPMIPYYPEVVVPELVLGEPTYFPLESRRLRDEVYARAAGLEGAEKEQQEAFSAQVFRAAQEYNAALEFLDQPQLEETQLKVMAERAQRAVLLFGSHVAGFAARHLLGEILVERASLDSEWDLAIKHLETLVRDMPAKMQIGVQLRYQRAVYRLGLSYYERNQGNDLESAARRFHQAGRIWRRDTLPKLSAVVESIPEDAEARYELDAAELASAKDLGAAAEVAELETRIQLDKSTKQEALIRKFLTLEGELADIARYRLGTRLYALGSFDLAAPLLVEAVRLAPEMAVQQPAMGVIVAESLRILEKEPQAERLLMKIIATDENAGKPLSAQRFSEDAGAYAFALIRLGDYAWKRGDRGKAKGFYARAVRDFPKTEGGFLARIRLVEVTGEIQAEDFPLEVFRRLQTRMSRLSDVSAEESMYREARARFLRSQYRLAYEKLLQIGDEFPDGFILSHDTGLVARVRLSLMEKHLVDGDYAQVVEAFVLAGPELDQSPVGARSFFLAGSAMNELGLYRQAIKAFQRALVTPELRQDQAQEEEVLLALSRAYLGNLDLFRARQTLDYDAALYPKGQHAGGLWLLRGEVAEVARRPDKAIIAYQQAARVLKEPMERAGALVRIGRLESARGAPGSAATAYLRAVGLYTSVDAEKPISDHIDAQFELGDAYYRLRNWRQAARAYAGAIELAGRTDERGAMAAFRIGEIRAILGDLAGALQDWRVLADQGLSIWHQMAAGAVEDLTWRLRHDGLLSQRR